MCGQGGLGEGRGAGSGHLGLNSAPGTPGDPGQVLAGPRASVHRGVSPFFLPSEDQMSDSRKVLGPEAGANATAQRARTVCSYPKCLRASLPPRPSDGPPQSANPPSYPLPESGTRRCCCTRRQDRRTAGKKRNSLAVFQVLSNPVGTSVSGILPFSSP